MSFFSEMKRVFVCSIDDGIAGMSVGEKVEKSSVGLKGRESLPNGDKLTFQPGRQTSAFVLSASTRVSVKPAKWTEKIITTCSLACAQNANIC